MKYYCIFTRYAETLPIKESIFFLDILKRIAANNGLSQDFEMHEIAAQVRELIYKAGFSSFFQVECEPGAWGISVRNQSTNQLVLSIYKTEPTYTSKTL